MPRRMLHAPSIRVSIWGRAVGIVYPHPKSGFHLFAYDKDFAESGIQLSPLSMPLRKGQPYLFEELPPKTFYYLPALLADAFPDAFGNMLIDEWMNKQGLRLSEVTPLDRLAYMGRRAIGALEFEPEFPKSRNAPFILDVSALVESARKALSGEISDDQRTWDFLSNLIQVGTSAGGARPKAVVAWNRKTGKMRSGQFDCPAGFEHWLLKFDGISGDGKAVRSQDDGRIEYAYHRMASQAGIAMAECDILEENGRAHFMTKRFDRDKNAKHHLQTLCAMAAEGSRFPASYEEIFKVMETLELPDDDRKQLFRRMVFNVLAMNRDDHTKNFSFILKKGESWRLAPAYDLMYMPGTGQCLSIEAKRAGIHRDDFLALGDRMNVPEARRLCEEVEEAVAAWPDFARKAGVREAHSSILWKDISATLSEATRDRRNP